jgi:O-6-methylguanine DNA methyltransferase
MKKTPTNTNVESEGSLETNDVDRTIITALGKLAEHPPASIERRVFGSVCALNGPIGTCYLAWTTSGICAVDLAEEHGSDEASYAKACSARFSRPFHVAKRPPPRAQAALRSGSPLGVAIDFPLLGPFAKHVLRATGEIPRGEVRSYSWIAAAIGKPKAVRAVGTALANNPVPFIVPCHRVVKSDGTVGNYGYGAPAKTAILSNEGVDLERLARLAASGVRYVGSATTHTFCLPSCRHVAAIAAKNTVGFASFDDALNARYRACRDCQPVPIPC